ncbi:DUF4489 domain-containing protein [Vallitalea okinawensis]|uniref:DUF4489 domain-containing protein n=1 Tax=Vallitalea okinawensis TaxID=2078660 RepID=UPI000CFBD1ED|nr:DUF4489 domain-containing protein [Vallitalea okinawensis]
MSVDRDCDIRLVCGEGSGSRTFTSSNETSFQLAHVTLETSCLDKTEVLIKFSSEVVLEKEAEGGRTARLKYELFRSCEGVEPTCLGTWIFEKEDSFNTRLRRLEESFNFNYCDQQKVTDCCDYFVSVTPLQLINTSAMVSNGQMAALISLKDEKRRKIEPRDTILVCGEGNGGAVFKENSLFLPVDIAHVSIDTTWLDQPSILIEFSSIIKLSEDIVDTILQFELLRVCGDSEPVSRGLWTFEVENSRELTNKTFNFIFCECQAISCSCEYFVRVIPRVIEESGTGVNDDVTVYSAEMVATAQGTKMFFKDYLNRRLLHKKQNEIMLICGDSSGSRTFTSASEQAFQLAHVTIDSTFLFKPIVDIQFSSIVSANVENLLDDANSAIQLRYELFRVCDNRQPLTLGVWEFELTNGVGSQRNSTTESFDFVYCDEIICKGCCDYFVTVTALEVTVGTDVQTVATVDNGRIAAIVSSSCCD